LDGIIDLTDAIIALQVMSGISTLNQPQISYADVNQDGRIGLPEAIYALQEVAGAALKIDLNMACLSCSQR
jgi:hypothetical protein